MKKKDVLETLLLEIGQALPEVRSILIDERDQYLAEEIRTAPGKKIVAVVGAGHVPGIQKYWDKEIDMEALDQMPPKGRLSGILKWGIPALIIGQKRKRSLRPWNGWPPCVAMFPTRGNRWSGIMVTTVTCPGASGKKRTTMNSSPRSWNRMVLQRHSVKIGRALSKKSMKWIPFAVPNAKVG
jgi:hypothetical protein